MIRVIFLCLALSACATPQSTETGVTNMAIEAAKPRIPDAWRTCLPEPKSPGRDATYRQDNLFTLRLIEAGRDCRTKLKAVIRAAD